MAETPQNFGRLEERAGFSLFGKLDEQLAVGTNVKYGYRRDYSLGIGNLSKWNFDVGGRFLISPQFALGLVGQNLLADESGIHPRMLAAGLEFRPAPALSLTAQVTRYIGLAPVEGSLASEIGYGAGAEYILPYSFSARAGYRRTTLSGADYLGLGLGHDAQSFGVHYSFETGLGKTTGVTHSVVLSGYL